MARRKTSANRANPFMTAALRQPFRSALLFLLIGLVSFAFITNTAEFIITHNEIDNIGSFYQTIGVLQQTDPTLTDVTQGALLLENSPYIAYTDWRRVASGLLTDMQNADLDGVQSVTALSTEAMFYGTISEIVSFELIDFYLDENNEVIHDNVGLCYEIKVIVDEIVVGRPENIELEQTVSIRVTPVNSYTLRLTEDVSWVENLQVGERYFLRAYESFQSYLWGNLGVAGFGSEFILNASGSVKPNNFLTFRPIVDTRTYTYIPRQESDVVNSNEAVSIFVQNSDEQTEYRINYISVQQGQSINLDNPALRGLEQEIYLARRNQRAIYVVGTKDMNTIPNRFEDRRGLSLSEGRWIDLTDYKEARQVCVINSSFALTRGLAVGDTIRLEMQDHHRSAENGLIVVNNDERTLLYTFVDYFPYILNNSVRDKMQSLPPPPIPALEFEIVGIYTLRDSFSSSDRNLVYIPNSVMPEGFGGDTLTSTEQFMFSFVLNSHNDIDAFVQEYRDTLASMGLRISFLENNAVAFWDIIEPLQNARLIAVIAYTLLLVLTLSLTAYLYLLWRRKEFAIMRSLGVPLRVVKRQLFLPIALIGGAGLAVGGFTAWRYALMQIDEVMAELPAGRFEIPDFEPPSALLLAVLYIAVFLLFRLCLLIGASGMSKRPVLELLQGGNYAGHQKRDRELADSETLSTILGGNMPVAGENVFVSTAYTQKGYNSLRSYITSGWFVLNKIIRTPIKTILTIAVAVMFVLTLGYISLLVERNETEIERLYSIVDIEAEITVGSVSVAAGMVATIPKAMIDAVRDSGFIMGTNVQMGLPWVITSETGTAGVAAHAIDKPDMLTGTWRNISMEYAQGWDETFFALDFEETEVIPIAVSKDIQAQLGLMPGDETMFRVMRDEGGTLYSFNVIIAAVYTKNNNASIITVMEKDNTVLIPFSMTELVSDRFLYNRAYFMIDPSQNRELAASTAELDRIIRDTRGNAPLSLVLWDEELRLVTQPLERTLSLLEALYPVILMASTMVPAGLAALMILQAKKLAAILRVLGTTRARVIAMQSSEQIVICLAGLVLGVITALVFLGTAIALSSSSFAQAALYLFGAFMGSMFAAIIATRKSPMELLQTKE